MFRNDIQVESSEAIPKSHSPHMTLDITVKHVTSRYTIPSVMLARFVKVKRALRSHAFTLFHFFHF